MRKSDFKIPIDAGHGRDTKGKRSPDGVFREWSWNKDVAEIVVEALRRRGYDSFLVNPEEKDITLTERCKRINAVCGDTYTDKVLSVSIHVNAAGDGKTWMKARGWEVYTHSVIFDFARDTSLDDLLGGETYRLCKREKQRNDKE